MPSPPSPGWYPDPERPRTLRYWDGQQWTTHRTPATGLPYAVRSGGVGLRAKAVLAIGAVLAMAAAGTVAAALSVTPASAPSDIPSGSASAAPPVVTAPRTTVGTAHTSPKPTTRPRNTASTTAPKKAPTVAAGLVAVTGVVDGDTIKVRLNGITERVRVIGIDTPELASRDCYAQQAASRMQSLVQSKQVRLAADPTQDNRDRYGRLLRHVHLADGRSVAQILIAGGFGREYTYDRAYAGQAAHLQAQRAAQAADRGIWSSGCASPVAPAPVAPAPSQPAAGSGRCVIKGNISSEGEKIYHVPGGAFYEQTQISLSKGERWFCSESEAVKAGWRASKR